MLNHNIALKLVPFISGYFILVVFSMASIYLNSFNNNTAYGQIQTEETGETVEDELKALISRGDSLHDSANYTSAIEYYDKALAIDPNNATALYNKGLSLYQLGRYEESIQHYDKVLAINPKNTNVLNDKGISLYELGKYKEAVEYYDKALAINPNDPDVLYNKDLALDQLGK